jgi:putative transposase
MREPYTQLKGASSHLVTHRLDPRDGFKWQGAYGAFTISKADVPRLRAYILHQEEHHRNQRMDQEYEPPVWRPGAQSDPDPDPSSA